MLRASASGKDGCDWSVPDKREIQLVTYLMGDRKSILVILNIR